MVIQNNINKRSIIMNKRYLILSVFACMLIIFNVKAQKTPIDNFLKKNKLSREGVTNVSMSPDELQSIFETHNKNASRIPILYSSMTVPEAYSSVTISKASIPTNLFADFKKRLKSSKYESFMEVNKENEDVGYYIKKGKKNINEIVVLQQKKNQFSAVYIKGDIAVNQVNNHLRIINNSLRRLSADNTNTADRQYTLTIPTIQNIQDLSLETDTFSLKFDRESFELLEKNLDNFKRDIILDIKEAQKLFQERSIKNKENK